MPLTKVEAHNLGFSRGHDHANYATNVSGESPYAFTPPTESECGGYFDAYYSGWQEGVEFYLTTDGEPIGSSDGIHYDECVHGENV
jgi:hypothetical protein